MTEGARFPALGRYLLVERSDETVTKIYFTEQPAPTPSILAERIIAYVEGRGPRPDVKLDLSGFTEFQKRVFAVVQEIPRGKTATYGEVAALAGSPGAARAVGQVMARNPFAILVPCHRVVSLRGIGGFAWGKEIKERLLLLEADRL
jgi:methylated-DNA-[protein]-cysteine S-methyltransferase